MQLSRAQPFLEAFSELGGAGVFTGDYAGPLGEESGPPPRVAKGSPGQRLSLPQDIPANGEGSSQGLARAGSRSSGLATGKERGFNLTTWLWDVAPQGRDPAENSTSLMRFILQIKGFPLTPIQREHRNTGARETWHKAQAQQGPGAR